MTDRRTTTSPDHLDGDEIAFDYIKASDFRTFLADGLIGGVTASGFIHFALYTERPALPRRQVHKFDPSSGTLGEPIPEKSISRNSVVREMACDVVMSPDVAISVAEWIVSQVKAAKRDREDK
jgi:hypothetical protein